MLGPRIIRNSALEVNRLQNENLIEGKKEMDGTENSTIPRLGVVKLSFNVKMFGLFIALLLCNEDNFINKTDIKRKSQPI